MISARDEFFLERETLNELQSMMDAAGLNSHEQEEMYEKLSGQITAEEFKQISLELIQRNLSELTRIRNGDTLSAKQINAAVKKAADTE